jgi:hypothetical protein
MKRDSVSVGVRYLRKFRPAEHEAQRRLLIRIGLVARNARVTDSYTRMNRQANPDSAGNAPTVTEGFGYPYIKGARDFD